MSEPIKSNSEQIEFWNGDAGQRWVRQQARLDAMLAGISAEILALAAPRSGEQVLDVGCGCGTTTLQLAEAVGPSGRVVGLDVSGPMLAVARSRAAAMKHVTFVKGDAAEHRFDGAQFDLLFSRFGVMFFADPDAAFANLRKSLKPSGRVAFVCWREARENDWVRIPVAAARAHVPPLPQPAPEDPGPFSFGSPGRLRRILANGGFDLITLRAFDPPMVLGDTLDDAVAHIQEFGPISRMLGDAAPPQRENAALAIREALTPCAASSPVQLGGATWLVTAKCR
jgi:SAM-dependent methyltransferase